MSHERTRERFHESSSKKIKRHRDGERVYSPERYCKRHKTFDYGNESGSKSDRKAGEHSSNDRKASNYLREFPEDRQPRRLERDEYSKSRIGVRTESEVDQHRDNVGETNHSKIHPKSEFVADLPKNNSKDSVCYDLDGVDWEEYRLSLDEIFFREVDFIKRNSQEYNDFWLFLKKYQDFQRRNPNKRSKLPRDEPEASNSEMGIPTVYDKRYRMNVSLGYKNLEDLLQKQPKHRNRMIPKLTVRILEMFSSILLHYIDFQQKQKFARLKKIKKDQQNLPIHQYKEEILEAVKQNQVVVVAGDTGCGKSTQVPQYLLEAGYENIACTQPRRIACISLSKRVSFETLNEYGSQVAFQVRFEKSRTKATKILFLTEGLLLRQIEVDSTLKQYNVILIDEVHERHIQTDFLLGVVKCILHQRHDLKLVLMSATINIQLFSKYFDDAPVCKVPGRLYPIQLQYVPQDSSDVREKKERLDPSPYLRILQLINHKYAPTERGDVLIFLSGMSDIMTVVEAAKEYAEKSKSWIILPLHSALSISEQDRVFDYAPEGIRKCIVSTNIAETSVTIDGVRFVIDSGKVKEMNYDTKFGMQKLQEFWISRASAEQRKGRAGRTGPGVCYRLYSEADYNAFQDYSTPEIHRVPLDTLLLQMISMGLPDARKFPFIEPPQKSSIETSIAFLKEQGALIENEQLTPIGELLAQLPVDVIVGKMLIMASIFQMIDPVLTIAAGLCVQSVFTSRIRRDCDVSSLRKPLESDHGDLLTLLNFFDSWVKVKAEGNVNSRKWCQKRGLEEQRFYEITKLKQQLHDLLADHGLLLDQAAAPDEFIDPNDRRQKVLDRKKLYHLKREQRKMTKKRKILKMEDGDWNIESDGEASEKHEVDDIEGSIKDLEFRLKNDMVALGEMADTSRNLTQKELTLLKVILCSGLYPQVAIADEHNSFKAESEQVFHTKKKGFVLLHPTSVFSYDPDVLELKEHEIKEISEKYKDSNQRGHLSNKHQLVTYLSLLETTKPYLVGLMRVPALQAALLFSSSLDTNHDCHRIVCDGWLEIRFTETEDADTVMSAVIRLRTSWHHLLKQKLALCGRNPGVDKIQQRKKLQHAEKMLSTKLAEFLHSDVFYYIRRIHAAEAQQLYVGPETIVGAGHLKDILGDLMQLGGDPHPVKGGLQVTPYLVYDCLQHDEVSSLWGEFTQCMQKHWTCPECQQSMIVTIAEKFKHQQECQQCQLVSGSEIAFKEAQEKVKQNALSAARKPYFCLICQTNFQFTTAEIFKHKKACSDEKD